LFSRSGLVRMRPFPSPRRLSCRPKDEATRSLILLGKQVILPFTILHWMRMHRTARTEWLTTA